MPRLHELHGKGRGEAPAPATPKRKPAARVSSIADRLTGDDRAAMQDARASSRRVFVRPSGSPAAEATRAAPERCLADPALAHVRALTADLR